jgi:hypothetical protein
MIWFALGIAIFFGVMLGLQLDTLIDEGEDK